jgi:hypothetical protein
MTGAPNMGVQRIVSDFANYGKLTSEKGEQIVIM